MKFELIAAGGEFLRPLNRLVKIADPVYQIGVHGLLADKYAPVGHVAEDLLHLDVAVARHGFDKQGVKVVEFFLDGGPRQVAQRFVGVAQGLVLAGGQVGDVNAH